MSNIQSNGVCNFAPSNTVNVLIENTCQNGAKNKQFNLDSLLIVLHKHILFVHVTFTFKFY